MPTCQSCHHEWSWSETFRKSFTLDTALTCPHCGNKQYITKKSRKRTSLLVFSIPLIMLLRLIFSMTPLISIILFVGVGLIVFISFPYLTELSNQEEPLW